MSAVPSDAPFIVTAELPPDLAKWASGLRQQHFPPDRNFLAAHVTLFHSLPPSAEYEIKAALARITAENAPISAILVGIMSLGRGTALRLSSPDMIAIWHELADQFHGLLIPQDEHPPRLHVTIQNKVASTDAKALQSELGPLVEKRPFRFAGLSLHIYRGGPWEPVWTYAFRG